MRLGVAHSVPDGLVHRLRAYDPDLRLRWGPASGRVRLERRVPYPLSPAHFRHHDPDGVQMALDGYDLVAQLEPAEETWQALEMGLRRADYWRRGGAKRVYADVTEQETRQEAARARNRDDALEQLSRDVARYFLKSWTRTLPEGAGNRWGTR